MNLSKKYKHILFDLDGTLWDYQKNSSQTLHELHTLFLLEKYVPPAVFIDEVFKANEHMWKLYREKKINKQELRDSRFQYVFNNLKINNPELAQELNNYFLLNCKQKTFLIDNTLLVLDYLAAKNYKLHIVSNGFTDSQLAKLINCKIDHYFSHVITSESSGYTKPNKEFFEFTLSTIDGDRNETIMIGDSYEIDIIGARNVGIDQVYLSTSLNKSNATFQIDNLNKLITIL